MSKNDAQPSPSFNVNGHWKISLLKAGGSREPQHTESSFAPSRRHSVYLSLYFICQSSLKWRSQLSYWEQRLPDMQGVTRKVKFLTVKPMFATYDNLLLTPFEIFLIKKVLHFWESNKKTVNVVSFAHIPLSIPQRHENNVWGCSEEACLSLLRHKD